MPLPFFSEKCVSLRKYVYSNSCHQRAPFPVPRISTISFDPMSLTSLQISPRYQRKPSILLSLIQQATLTEFFPVYSELTLFWIKICILPRYCKKRFIFTSCYRAAVKQMTRRKRDFSGELKGMWAVKVVRQKKTPCSGANINWSSRQKMAEHEDLQLKILSVRVIVNALATFCKIRRAKENRNF